jgi:hypothetical protein
MNNVTITIFQLAIGAGVVINTFQIAEFLTRTNLSDYRTLALMVFGAITCLAAVWGLEGRKE